MNYLEKKKKAMLNAIASGGRLPSEYQEVEWIGRLSGNPYIDTDYIPKIETDMRLVYLMPTTSGNIAFTKEQVYFGLQQVNNNAVQLIRGGVRVNFNGIPYNVKHDLTFGKNGVICDDVILAQTIGTDRNETLPVTLFAYVSTIAPYSSDVKIYNCQFIENGVKERDFIPCYRKADQEIGMYDLVTNTFFTNSGTGTFTKGQDV